MRSIKFRDMKHRYLVMSSHISYQLAFLVTYFMLEQHSNLPFVLSIQKSQIGLHAKSTVFLNESFWQICSSFWAIFLTPLFVHCNSGLSAYCQADKPQESWCIFRWQEEKVILNRCKLFNVIYISFDILCILWAFNSSVTRSKLLN